MIRGVHVIHIQFEEGIVLVHVIVVPEGAETEGKVPPTDVMRLFISERDRSSSGNLDVILYVSPIDFIHAAPIDHCV